MLYEICVGFVITSVIVVAVESIIFSIFKARARKLEDVDFKRERLFVQKSIKNLPFAISTEGNSKPELTQWLNAIAEYLFSMANQSETFIPLIASKLNEQFIISKHNSKVIKSMVIQDLSLGKSCPTISNAQVVSTDPDSKDLVIALHLEYQGGVVLNITSELSEPIPRLNFKAQVNKISADLQITFSELPRVEICLTKPTIDFSVNIEVGEANNSLLEGLIVKNIRKMISDAIVHPNSIKIDLQTQPDSKRKDKKAKAIGVVTLKPADRNGLSDPYCIIRCGKEERKTKVKPKTLNPEWNESFEIPIFEATSVITVDVYDHDRISKDDFLGQFIVKVGTEEQGNEEKIEKLKTKTGSDLKGELFYTIMFEKVSTVARSVQYNLGEDGKLTLQKPVLGINVIGATNLIASDSNGFSDPYCKIFIGKLEKKTKKIKKTLNPRWDERFGFILEDLSSDILFQVYDWDLGSTDDFLGQVKVPLSSLEFGNTIQTLALKGRTEDEKVTGTITVQIQLTRVSASEVKNWVSSYQSQKSDGEDIQEWTKVESKEDVTEDEFKDFESSSMDLFKKSKVDQSNTPKQQPPFRNSESRVSFSSETITESSETESTSVASAITESAITSKIVHTGRLKKLSNNIFKKWQERDFTLHEDALIWKSGRKTSKRLKISEFKKIEEVPESKFSKKYVFLIELPKKTYYLRAEDKGSLFTWLSNLQQLKSKTGPKKSF